MIEEQINDCGGTKGESKREEAIEDSSSNELTKGLCVGAGED